MDRLRIAQLRQELDLERISYGELAEIDSAAIEAGITLAEDMFAGNVLDELEARLEAAVDKCEKTSP